MYVTTQGRVLTPASGPKSRCPAVAMMTLDYGGHWTNVVQPFRALSLLAIAALKSETFWRRHPHAHCLGLAFEATMVAVSF